MIEIITFLNRDISLYYTFWIIALIIAFICGWKLRKYYQFSFSGSTMLVALDLAMGYLLIWITSWIFGGFKMSGFNIVRIVNFVPLYFVLLAHLFKVPLWKVSDYLAPVGAFFIGVSRFGCMFAGCCQGYPSEWGIFNKRTMCICFPIQPIEAIVSILIGAILYWMAVHKKQQGRLYLWYMVLFGGTRFILEFFRDNRKIWYNISELAMHALAAFILGTVILIYLTKKEIINHEDT